MAEFADYFYPINASNVDYNFKEEPNDLLFSAQEISYAFSKKGTSSPGPDNLDNAIINFIFKSFPWFCKIVFNKCFLHHVFPEVWKQGLLRAIPKTGNRDMLFTKSYRPITLLPTFGKALERILSLRLNHHIEHLNLMNCNQHGFRQGKSTITALEAVVSFARKAFQEKAICHIISIDIKGAFDNITWGNVFTQLDLLGVPMNIKRMLQNYFKNREIIFKMGDNEITRTLYKGCPKGRS